MPGKQIVLLLLGPTRSGKTSFARCVATPLDGTLDRGSTTACKEYTNENGRFLLIDTPGLDDSPAGNLAVLYKIANKVKSGPQVHGVIYFHRVTNSRLTGSARSNIDIFREICGVPFFAQTVFVTTMWNTVNSAARPRFESLELEL